MDTDETPEPETPGELEPSHPATAGQLGQTVAEFLKTPGALAKAFESFALPESSRSVAEALKSWGKSGPQIDAELFDGISRRAEENRRLLEAFEPASIRPPVVDPEIYAIEAGPSAEEELLNGLREDMAELRTITAGQATNVALQAQLAAAQSEKLDHQIVSLDALTVAIIEAARRTESLERTALRVAAIALAISVIVAIPVVVNLGLTVGKLAGLIPPDWPGP